MPEVLFIVDRAASWLPPLASALIARGWRAAVLAPADAPAMAGFDPVFFAVPVDEPVGTSDHGATEAMATEAMAPVLAPTLASTLASTLAPGLAPGLAPALAKALATGRAAARSARDLAEAGHRPDLLIGDPAAGAMLFLDAALGPVPQIQLGEGWSNGPHDPAPARPLPAGLPAALPEARLPGGQSIRADVARAGFEARIDRGGRDAPLALSHVKASAIVVAGRSQAGLIPACFHPRIHVIEDPAPHDPARPCPPGWLDLVAAVTGRVLEPPVTVN